MTDQPPARDSAVNPPGAKALATIDAYYACFNQRRFRDAANLFAADAVLEHIPLGQSRPGREGYLHFANAWVNAFPDVVIDVERVQSRSETLFDVDLVSRGTHLGDLDFGVYLFKPSQSSTSLKLRELLEVQGGTITRSTLSFDINDAVRQLARVDFPELAARLDRIRQLGEALDGARFDAERLRQLVDRLRPELDAARRAVRPHYNR